MRFRSSSSVKSVHYAYIVVCRKKLVTVIIRLFSFKEKAPTKKHETIFSRSEYQNELKNLKVMNQTSNCSVKIPKFCHRLIYTRKIFSTTSFNDEKNRFVAYVFPEIFFLKKYLKIERNSKLSKKLKISLKF